MDQENENPNFIASRSDRKHKVKQFIISRLKAESKYGLSGLEKKYIGKIKERYEEMATKTEANKRLMKELDEVR